jgi:primary-amine oxidase
VAHPLDPLTSDEIRWTVQLLGREKGIDERWRFATIMLREPPKAELAAWSPGRPHRREAEVILWNRADGLAYEAVVDLGAGTIAEWIRREGVQPCFTHDEFYEADAMLRAHPEVVAALARHGIDDPALVLFDTWAYGGALVPERYVGRRIGWTDVWSASTTSRASRIGR